MMMLQDGCLGCCLLGISRPRGDRPILCGSSEVGRGYDKQQLVMMSNDSVTMVHITDQKLQSVNLKKT